MVSKAGGFGADTPDLLARFLTDTMRPVPVLTQTGQRSEVRQSFLGLIPWGLAPLLAQVTQDLEEQFARERELVNMISTGLFIGCTILGIIAAILYVVIRLQQERSGFIEEESRRPSPPVQREKMPPTKISLEKAFLIVFSSPVILLWYLVKGSVWIIRNGIPSVWHRLKSWRPRPKPVRKEDPVQHAVNQFKQSVGEKVRNLVASGRQISDQQINELRDKRFRSSKSRVPPHRQRELELALAQAQADMGIRWPDDVKKPFSRRMGNVLWNRLRFVVIIPAYLIFLAANGMRRFFTEAIPWFFRKGLPAFFTQGIPRAYQWFVRVPAVSAMIEVGTGILNFSANLFWRWPVACIRIILSGVWGFITTGIPWFFTKGIPYAFHWICQRPPVSTFIRFGKTVGRIGAASWQFMIAYVPQAIADTHRSFRSFAAKNIQRFRDLANEGLRALRNFAIYGSLTLPQPKPRRAKHDMPERYPKREWVRRAQPSLPVLNEEQSTHILQEIVDGNLEIQEVGSHEDLIHAVLGNTPDSQKLLQDLETHPLFEWYAQRLAEAFGKEKVYLVRKGSNVWRKTGFIYVDVSVPDKPEAYIEEQFVRRLTGLSGWWMRLGVFCKTMFHQFWGPSRYYLESTRKDLAKGFSSLQDSVRAAIAELDDPAEIETHFPFGDYRDRLQASGLPAQEIRQRVRELDARLAQFRQTVERRNLAREFLNLRRNFPNRLGQIRDPSEVPQHPEVDGYRDRLLNSVLPWREIRRRCAELDTWIERMQKEVRERLLAEEFSRLKETIESALDQITDGSAISRRQDVADYRAHIRASSLGQDPIGWLTFELDEWISDTAQIVDRRTAIDQDFAELKQRVESELDAIENPQDIARRTDVMEHRRRVETSGIGAGRIGARIEALDVWIRQTEQEIQLRQLSKQLARQIETIRRVVQDIAFVQPDDVQGHIQVEELRRTIQNAGFRDESERQKLLYDLETVVLQCGQAVWHRNNEKANRQIGHDPKFEWVRVRMGKGSRALKDHRFSEALEYFQSIEADAALPVQVRGIAAARIAAILRRSDKFAALKHIEGMLRKDPWNIFLESDRAFTLLYEGRHQRELHQHEIAQQRFRQAVDQADAVIRKEPFNAPAWKARIAALTDLSDYIPRNELGKHFSRIEKLIQEAETQSITDTAESRLILAQKRASLGFQGRAEVRGGEFANEIYESVIPGTDEEYTLRIVLAYASAKYAPPVETRSRYAVMVRNRLLLVLRDLGKAGRKIKNSIRIRLEIVYEDSAENPVIGRIRQGGIDLLAMGKDLYNRLEGTRALMEEFAQWNPSGKLHAQYDAFRIGPKILRGVLETILADRETRGVRSEIRE
ncbi:MAG: hypothetical protein NC930_08035, partial [Candidatus Omnitrophica bacterium]|nr:hypothetical protein [Candidatus Omnitrophota bacterium]